MAAKSTSQMNKISKELASTIQANPSSTISKKDGHAAIRLYTIGTNSKNYPNAPLANTQTSKKKQPNSTNRVPSKMPPMLSRNNSRKIS